MKIKDLVIIAIFTAIIIVFEQTLQFIPNVQLTLFFIILFYNCLGFKKTLIIVVLNTIIDNLISGFNLLVFIPMLIGLSLIPILEHTLFKKINNIFLKTIISILYAFLYSWCFIIPFSNLMGISFIDYFLSDISYELILALSTALSVLILYKPLYKLIIKILGGNENEGSSISNQF